MTDVPATDQAISEEFDDSPIIHVELRPHIGERVIDGVRVPIDMQQYYIMLGGVHAGWMPKNDSGWPLLFMGYGELAEAEIKRQIEAIIGREVKKLSIVNRMGTEEEEALIQRVVSPGDLEGQDEDDEF